MGSGQAGTGCGVFGGADHERETRASGPSLQILEPEHGPDPAKVGAWSRHNIITSLSCAAGGRVSAVPADHLTAPQAHTSAFSAVFFPM